LPPKLTSFLAVDGDDKRRAVLGDWRRRLIDRGQAPSTVNLALAAASSLLDSSPVRSGDTPAVACRLWSVSQARVSGASGVD
jgi:hypothetical protein